MEKREHRFDDWFFCYGEKVKPNVELVKSMMDLSGFWINEIWLSELYPQLEYSWENSGKSEKIHSHVHKEDCDFPCIVYCGANFE